MGNDSPAARMAGTHVTSRAILPGLVLVLLAVTACALAVGASPATPVAEGLRDWLAGRTTAAALVMGEIRLPRVLLALAVGASLGLAGAALQGLLRNPLADPGLTGASQGAALGAASVFYFDLFPQLGVLAPALAGLVGAGVTLCAMLALAGSSRADVVILAGLAVSTVAGAALATVLNFSPNPFAMQELVFWLLGSVADRGMPYLALLFPALCLGGVILWRQRRLLAALGLGEAVAESMGLDCRRGSRWIILGAALLVGASVSVAGNIGFVGLMVPHLARPLVSNRPERLLLPSALIGATLVAAADTGVRLLPPGRELKVGILTSLVGAPFFIWFVWKERGQWR
jgi:iron complex transport system permease protein